VSIGATLAAARRRAGLTVGDVSRSTRVTEPIIRGIEHDDYAACGGDFYARGHVRAIAEAVGVDPAPLVDEFDSTWGSSKEVTAAEVFRSSMPIRRRERRRVRWTAALAVLVLAALGFASYKLVSGASRGHHPSAASLGRPASATGSRPSPAAQSGTAISSSAPSAPSASSPPPSVTPVATQVLVPASVAAFGPAGTADGDGPQLAAMAVSGDPATPWYSDWYATPEFGNLQAGTGLLLDMGRAVTVSSVQVWMTTPGADLQLRAGSSPVQSAMTTVADVTDAGRVAQLQAGMRARYLLIWFTKLPPDDAGTYQVGVYKVTVQGQH
jgi:cytoskeletal protein RodZ